MPSRPPSGAPTLFSSAPEEPGDHCEYGGIALHWGVDSNRDGDLTVQEVTGTDYVCNGAPGPSLYCAVIVKTVDAQTRSKTGVNELLRD